MAIACNLSATDRAIRITLGMLMVAAAAFLRNHLLAASLLALGGLATVVGGTIGF